MSESEVRGREQATAGEPTVSLLEVGTVMLRYRRLVAGWMIALPLLVLVLAFLGPRHWTTRASFTPQGTGDIVPGQLAMLAGQFGIDVGPTGGSETPEFYAALIRSTAVLMPIVRDTFRLTGAGDPAAPDAAPGSTLPELLDIDEPDIDEAEEEALEWLQDEALRVGTDVETGIVEVSVTTEWPGVSAQINRKVLDGVAAFNLRKRQTQAGAEREFIEGQMEEARAGLLEAEQELEAFLEANRSYRQSPQLLFEYERLQRRVGMRQQVYTSLVQSYEQARIGEVRNTPVITIVEEPRVPAQPDSRRLVTRLAGGLLAGMLFGVLTAFGRENLRRRRGGDGDELAEMTTLWEDTKRDLLRLVTLGARGRRPAPGDGRR